MTPGPAESAVAVMVLLAMAGYALLGGADFGGGVWDLLAGGTERGRAPRATIDASVTPVWEANHVWLIFILVLAWTGFPTAFAAAMTTLFVPLSLSLLGIVTRGVGFAFRHQVHHPRSEQLLGAVFAASSVLAPFFLGTCVGAIATGRVRVPPGGNALAAWTNPTALLTGGLFLAACAYIGAIYLVGDAQRRGEPALVRYFRIRAAAAGVASGVLAAGTLASMAGTAPWVFGRLLGPALPMVAVSVAAGLAALVLVARGGRWATRVALRGAAALTVAAVIAGWAWAQYPWVLPGTLSVQAGAAPTPALLAEAATMGLVVVLVAPFFGYLFWLHQRDLLGETDSAEDLRQAVDATQDGADERP